MPSDRPPPVIRIDAGGSGMQVALAGDWTLQGLCPLPEDLRRELAVAPPEGTWNLAGVTRLDSFGAVLLWRHWGRRRPAHLDLPEALAPVLARAEALPGGDLPAEPGYRFLDGTAQLGRAVHAALHHLLGFVALVGHILIGLGGLLRRRDYWPLREISANFYKVGVRAMPVTALVGFLIGAHDVMILLVHKVRALSQGGQAVIFVNNAREDIADEGDIAGLALGPVDLGIFFGRHDFFHVALVHEVVERGAQLAVVIPQAQVVSQDGAVDGGGQLAVAFFLKILVGFHDAAVGVVAQAGVGVGGIAAELFELRQVHGAVAADRAGGAADHLGGVLFSDHAVIEH